MSSMGDRPAASSATRKPVGVDALDLEAGLGETRSTSGRPT